DSARWKSVRGTVLRIHASILIRLRKRACVLPGRSRRLVSAIGNLKSTAVKCIEVMLQTMCDHRCRYAFAITDVFHLSRRMRAALRHRWLVRLLLFVSHAGVITHRERA